MNDVLAVLKQAEKISLLATMLPSSRVDELAQRIENRFSATPHTSSRLWERLRCPAFRNRMAWRRVGEFVGDRPVFLLVEIEEGLGGLLFASGLDVVPVLDGVEWLPSFYLTDPDVSYVLGYNNHDVLIGCGDAQPWVEGIRNQETYGRDR